MRVLFICYGNAYRSPLAEALLKKIRPDLHVESAGISVSIPISTSIKEFLKINRALQYLKKTPESLDHKNLKNYNLIVTMQNIQTNAVLQRCPECKNKIIEWNIKDPYFLDSKSAKSIFNEINKKVKELANSI
ncbi:MAG: low molecular weight phosphatase family protein [Candidatus Bathyarchaeota archaeon]|jgi:protein-tyrosine phosphatase|nr:low molecular weight phosphatase family protein [Candidatus Bathyarchaeota archaeon]